MTVCSLRHLVRLVAITNSIVAECIAATAACRKDAVGKNVVGWQRVRSLEPARRGTADGLRWGWGCRFSTDPGGGPPERPDDSTEEKRP